MYNEPRRLVSVFKDYLIYDDFSEYLKREYKMIESKERLIKIFQFYDKYSKVFPNYVSMPLEARFMFKNIERKQKLIDQLEKRKQLQAEELMVKQSLKGKKHNKRYNCVGNTVDNENSNLFTTRFVKEMSQYKFHDEDEFQDDQVL